MINRDDKRLAPHQIRPAEYARMSTSRKLSLLAIRRAQLSSRLEMAAVNTTDKRKGNP